MTQSAEPVFPVKVHTAEGIVSLETVTALSSGNAEGPFSILPEHTNFITVITEPVILHLTDGKQKKLTCNSGILRCFDSSVEVFI